MSTPCSLFIIFLFFCSVPLEIKSGAWVKNKGDGAFGVMGQVTKRSPFAVL